ncbi:MAG TPA: hypothetical protein DD738_15485 [Ruminiclostridium sp.]|nr:hypothetical protein [Ruminiclostridium sp.]
MYSIEDRLLLHREFWEGKTQKAPLVSYRIGDYFFSNKFQANLPLLEKGKVVTPDMIDVEAYLEDFDRMYAQCEEIGQTAFFTVEPCVGFPWMEAILGCDVIGGEVAFISDPKFESIEDLEDLHLDKNNPWYIKYIEFLDKLTRHAKGRYPVGQPIMRGVTDTVGALIGQEEMACSLITDPELTGEIFMKVSNVQRAVIEEQYRHIQPFHGGYSAGFYHLWAPGKFIWYQEDLSALMSPPHFDQFLRKTANNTCSGYDYTLLHLHPSSFFHLDKILSIKGLKVVEINKDVGGPSITEMLSQFRQVLEAGKHLMVWGDLTEAEVDLILGNLPSRRLFFNIIAPTVDRAREINEHILKAQ